MARPGGNPALKNFQFLPTGEKTMNGQIGLKLSMEDKNLLVQIPGWPNILRKAISQIISEHQSNKNESQDSSTMLESKKKS